MIYVITKILLLMNLSGIMLDGNLRYMIDDFAILHLAEEVSLNEKIDMIRLPKAEAECPLGVLPFVISGWGKDRPKHPNGPVTIIPSTRFLQAVRQECFNSGQCGVEDNDSHRVWCVGDSTNRQNGPCVGDSGGKLPKFYKL